MEVNLGDKGIPEVIWSLEVDSSLQNIPTWVLRHLTLNIQVMWVNPRFREWRGYISRLRK